MDRLHPDVSAETTLHPDWEKMKPLVIEVPRRPSRWITLQALRVFKRVGDASQVPAPLSRLGVAGPRLRGLQPRRRVSASSRGHVPKRPDSWQRQKQKPVG